MHILKEIYSTNQFRAESQVRKNYPFEYSVFLLMFHFLTGCSTTGSEPSEAEAVFEYNFREAEAGWEPFFTDYNIDNTEGMNLRSGYRTLPEPLNTSDMAHFISAVNQSDDVKMLFRKRVTDLQPNTEYGVEFMIRFATSVPSGCFGIGGPPGEAVRVIADASSMKPQAIVEDGYFRLNIQQAADSQTWYQNAIMGDIANSRECEDGYEYEIKELSSEPDHATVRTDTNGTAWLMFGTRSGFEGQTDLYYTYMKAEFYSD